MIFFEYREKGGYMRLYIYCLSLLCVPLLQGTFELTSPAFKHDGMIPVKYTCDGENVSPALQWSGAPLNTKSYVLIVDDPDAPAKVWVHWIVYNILPTTTFLEENASIGGFAGQGATDFNGAQKYGGPCPPSGIHNYQFTLYALNAVLSPPPNVDKPTLLQLMDGHVLEQTTLIGRYQRKK